MADWMDEARGELGDGRASDGDSRALVYWAILLAFFAAYLWVHRLAGLTFPVPWPDEGTFLWQALAVARDNTLFAPQVNSDRAIMWMPPGYMIVQGLIFKLTGFSFAWARMLSALYLLGAMAALAAMFRRRGAPLAAALLCGGFLMNRDFVFMGNLARTDAMFLLLICVGFLLLQRGLLFAALAAVWASPLIHPNGVYFCATLGVYSGFTLWRNPSRRSCSRAEAVALAVAAGCWLSYLAYASLHWDHLVSDMGFALTWKGQAGLASSEFWLKWIESRALIRWMILLALLAQAVWRRASDPALLLLALSLQILDITTVGWMYRVHESVLHLVLTVLCLIAVADCAAGLRVSATPRWGGALGWMLAALALVVNLGIGEIEDVRGYPSGLEIMNMRISNSPPYLQDDDVYQLGHLLQSLQSEERITRVGMYPWGEAILYQHLESDRLQFTQPNFHAPDWDYLIVHLSRHLPDNPPLLPTKKIRSLVRGHPVAFERDRTERWVYKRPEKKIHSDR